MTPFLQQVVQHYFAAGDVGGMCFILPNRRALAFFRKYLGEEVGRSGRPMAAPLMFTMNDFFYRVAGKEKTGGVPLLITLYDCYRKLNPGAEGLDDFIFWGDVLLSDFNDVDKYLVDPEKIFANVADFRNIQDSWEYLNDSQREALEHFAGHFRTSGDYKEKFLGIWSLLLPLYRAFNCALESRGESYEGMVYRGLAERLSGEAVVDVLPENLRSAGKFVFVGLNALNECEKRLLSKMRDAGVAEFCWDYSSDMIRDPRNKSSFFMAANVSDYPQAFRLDPDGLPETEINVVSVPSSIGQAKQLPSIFGRLPEVGISTAVVLPDESLLLSVLNSIPEDIGKLNVTMGYPMSGSELWSLMNDIAALQLNSRESGGRLQFYHRNVWAVFSNSLFKTVLSDTGREQVEKVKKSARYYVNCEDLSSDPVLECIFRPCGDDIPGYLTNILRVVAPLVRKNGEMSLELDFARDYYMAIGSLCSCEGLDIQPATFFRLMNRIVAGKSVPFLGEPLEGLQIMGPLETRALDFDNLIVLNCNEGVFPRRSVSGSFIPPELRKGFGLPTYEYQDAVWAYYFYRMIQRSSRVWLLFDSRMEISRSGEPSRYISQLELHFGVKVNSYVIKAPVGGVVEADDIEKSPEMLDALKEKYLSASALQNYLACPAKFYYHTVCGLKPDGEVAESLDAGMFGSVFHKVVQGIYSVEDGIIRDSYLKSCIASGDRIKDMVREGIKEALRTDEVSGKNVIYEDMICRNVRKVLERDLELMSNYSVREFRILGLELKRFATIGGFRFIGYIDRLDSFVPGEMRIVDYKTGSVDDQKVGLQLYLYDMFVRKEALRSGCRLVNSIYQVSRLFVEPVSNTEVDPESPFGSLIEDTLAEIANPDVPFRHTEDTKVCSKCDFKQICGR